MPALDTTDNGTSQMTATITAASGASTIQASMPPSTAKKMPGQQREPGQRA